MGKYTDDEIRAMPKITAKIAADYLGISPMMVTLGMRNSVLPINFAIKKRIGAAKAGAAISLLERLSAYHHGRGMNRMGQRRINGLHLLDQQSFAKKSSGSGHF